MLFWFFTVHSIDVFLCIIETFTNSVLSEEIVNESGVCQNCFIKFNEYDEHQTLAEQIQLDLLSLMENKIFTIEENEHVEQKIKMEAVEENSVNDDIEYEPFETEEMFVGDEEGEEVEEDETVIESIEEDYHYEIVVDDTKENIKGKQIRSSVPKPRNSDVNEFIIIELDDNSRVYQCDICLKTFKDRSKLRSHREIHTEERNVICPVCHKGFKTMNCLRNHKRLHLPERTYYNCDQCDKKYTQKVMSHNI